MQFTVMPELPSLLAPEIVAKTDQSITLRVKQLPNGNEEAQYKLQASYSEHGYVYYSWIDSVTFSSTLFPVKGLKPNTTYVFRVRVVDEIKCQCGEWSPLTPNTRTFTEEEDAKRSGTVFEHALKLEREQKSILKGQISKLTDILEERKVARESENRVQQHEDMLASRRIIDSRLSKLQQELSMQTIALQTVKSQRAADELMISELLNEQEKLRAAQIEQQGQVQYELEMQTLRERLEMNEEALRKHQEQVNASHEQIMKYEASLEAKKSEITQKEEEVERIMADCNRMVQEQADLAHVKQLEVEDALLEAKTSLEQQLDINTYLRDEVSRLREENHHLKNQIEEVDSEIVPKLVRLEDENEQLRAQLCRR
ncbi:Immunoglobulin-like fold [Plasmopara halstedii]|uniref:Immunoglobulin-like fold n=1 Tax=Plasmopara halstedii TaxID=4781 RepID=A0A0P1AKQ0_PLAHL|nr:Immunoglobulin-like fold [Plasmopara halstedii]CEG41623.1 Immunoglobulin-like fold [Plasmopara halstedii]|eukprot:XP_024577992.1 Immunoglobulin-like fold [Plasmopara halstedii]